MSSVQIGILALVQAALAARAGASTSSQSKNGTGPNKQGQSSKKDTDDKNKNGKVKAAWTRPTEILGMKVVEDKQAGFDPEIDPGVFAWVLPSMLDNPDNEISGYGRVDINDDGDPVITFMDDPVAIGSSGGVTTPAALDAMGMMRVVEATGKAANLHYHTHPGFNTFWSHTDERDMLGTVEDAARVKDSGEIFFIVAGHGFTDWLMRRYTWDKADGKIRYCDSKVWLYHTQLDVDGGIGSYQGYGYSYGSKYQDSFWNTGWQMPAGPTSLDDDDIPWHKDDAHPWIKGVSMDRSELAFELGYDDSALGVQAALDQLREMYPKSWMEIANTPQMWSANLLWANAYGEEGYESRALTVQDKERIGEVAAYLGMDDGASFEEVNQELQLAYGMYLFEYLDYNMTIQDLAIEDMAHYYAEYGDDADDLEIGEGALMAIRQQGEYDDNDTVSE